MKKISIFLLVSFIHNCVSANVSYTKETQMKNPNTNLNVLKLKNKSAKLPHVETLILFRSNLAANTDGSPYSYNSIHLDGGNGAVNTICNAISVTKGISDKNLCRWKSKDKVVRLKYKNEAIQAFKGLMQNNWVRPKDSPYAITYENVLSLTKNKVPCIFNNTIEFKGYFGSETALKNDIAPDESGECGYKNQVDSLKVSGFVLPKLKSNPLNAFGANKGDLLFVYNPTNNTSSFAIINDIGNADNAGEGSIKLLMNLRNKTISPTSYNESKELAIDSNELKNKPIVVIFSKSKNFKIEKPFSDENIRRRGLRLLKDAGFDSEMQFIEFMKKSIVE